MPITQRNKIGMLEAMLFANAEPVETDRLAEAMRADPAEVLTLLEKLQKRYDETESGLMLLHFDGDRWQMATRPYYGEVVKRILDTRRNAPLSPAALEVLAIIAYNQPVSRSFIEQVRGVDSSSTVSKLMERGLIEEAGRLDLPGKPVAFRVTDTFLQGVRPCSLADLPRCMTTPRKKKNCRCSKPWRNCNERRVGGCADGAKNNRHDFAGTAFAFAVGAAAACGHSLPLEPYRRPAFTAVLRPTALYPVPAQSG